MSYIEPASDKSTYKNLQSFFDPIEMPGGYAFNHVDTLKRINLYYISQFESGNKDRQGFRKFFYNITKPACDVATKFIDLDTKDIIFSSEHPDDEHRVWLMQQDFKQWSKNNNFAQRLNDIAIAYPKYGSVVLRVDKEVELPIVNLENLRFDTSVSSLEDSSYVYEISEMDAEDIRGMKAWDQDAIEELLARPNDGNYVIYLCYDKTGGAKEWTLTIKADLHCTLENGKIKRAKESLINDTNRSYLPSVVLFTSEVDELPYRELHYEKIPGRWLGLGFVEYLFDNQIRRNELVNLKAKGLLYSSLKLFQTRDETIGRNILTEMNNGDILKVMSEITPIANEERNLAAFSQEEQEWDKNKVEKTFTTDISRGENLPSRTPLGVANIQATMVSSYFELKRENFGIFIRQLLLNDVIPAFQRWANKEHKLMFAGSEAEMGWLDEAIAKQLVEKDAVKYLEKTGYWPNEEEYLKAKESHKSNLKSRRGRYFSMPEGFYKNARYMIDVNLTNEQVDSGALQTTLSTMMQILGTNPAVMKDPGLRSIMFKSMELAGVSPLELNMLNEQIKNAPPSPALPQGGSMASFQGMPMKVAQTMMAK